jgi:hypothetical protein
MTQQHPITPPPELVQQWLEELYGGPVSVISPFDQRVLIAAAQWGADHELEACCEWVKSKQTYWAHDELRATRRPKPLSLKEQALEQLDGIAAVFRMTHGGNLVCDTIRRALEQLND